MYSNNVPRPVRRLLLLVTFLATVCLIQLPAYAQQDQGRIAGIVTDSNGAIVPVHRSFPHRSALGMGSCSQRL